MGGKQRPFGRIPSERIEESALKITHACGEPILILKISMYSGHLSAYGICRRCERYVYLTHEQEKRKKK